MNINTIVIPDVHGRDFWKIIENHPDKPVIFLGDYLDPYPGEATPQEAIRNFSEILKVARKRDNITLLVGNHDLCYDIGRVICECRCNYEKYDIIRAMFNDNKEMFKIAEYREIGGKKFLFTHAGITPEWVREECGKVLPNDFAKVLTEADYLNRSYKRHWYEFCQALRKVSYHRGGLDHNSSMVWCDANEHIENYAWRKDEECDANGIIQVFGHTYLKVGVHAFVPYEIYCLDCAKPWCITDEGEIVCLTDMVKPLDVVRPNKVVPQDQDPDNRDLFYEENLNENPRVVVALDHQLVTFLVHELD